MKNKPCRKSNCKYYKFFESVSCLFVEGVELLTKDQIYNTIKLEWEEIIKRQEKRRLNNHEIQIYS